MWEAFSAFHICIACLQPERLRRPVVERAVRTLVVVLAPPACQGAPYVIQRLEPACVEALVAQPSVEGFDMPVLHRLAGPDVYQPDLPVLHPAEHAPRGELRAVVRAQVLGRPRSSISRSSTRVTRSEPRLVSSSSARYSRVYALTTLRIRTIRPVAKPSTMKPIAHSWLGRTSRGSSARSRTSLLRLRRRTASPSSAYSR